MNQKEYILAIKDKYAGISEDEIPTVFFNMYCVPNSNDVYKDYLNKIFSVYHSKLNTLITEFNYRINGTRHFRAQESRELIYLRNNIFELQEATNNSKYRFRIKYNYFCFLQGTYKYLSESGGSTIPDTVTAFPLEKYNAIFELLDDSDDAILPDKTIQEILKMVSTRNAEFEEMTKDEKLSSLNLAIEYLLKDKNNYKKVDNSAFCGLINDSTIMDFRKKTHCFRHASKEAIDERKLLTDKQKDFLINFGLSIVLAII